MTSTIHDQRALVDPRAVGALPQASADVVAVWDRATSCAVGVLPTMGLLAGDRPTADVEVLAGAFAAVEYELARRLHAATTAGSLPLVGPGAVLAARGWASPRPADWPAPGRSRPRTRRWPQHGRPGSSPPNMWTRSRATSAR